MLDSKGFDLWADSYDKSVDLSDGANRYPFAGYRAILAEIDRIVLEKSRPAVLDLGFGTGTLTCRLYEQGCKIYGQDFSARMLELAQARMPEAALFQGDFSGALAAPLLRNSYDFIIATYSLHHLADADKVRLLRSLTGLLRDGGRILIGDVAFSTRAELERCRREAGGDWDESEIYFVFDELQKALPQLRFRPFSPCSGLLSLAR